MSDLLQPKITNGLTHQQLDEQLLRVASVNLTAVALDLLSHGAKVDARDQRGRTPLMLALDNDNPGLAELLIERGADLDAIDNGGRSVESYAHRQSQYDLLRAGRETRARNKARQHF